MSQKVINQGVLVRFGCLEYFSKYVGNPHIYQTPFNCFIAACEIGAHEALFKL